MPEYDYSQTELVVFYGKDGYVLLGPPLEHPAPNMGALVYEMILLYIPQFQEIIIPPADPTHVMDLLMRDRNGLRRIGQRLYLGNAWLSDGRNIAFLKPADYQRLADLLHERYAGANTDHYDPRQLADMRRPTKEELPDNWLPGAKSVARAISHMSQSEYEYDGYDPGAAIRHKAGKKEDASRENHSGEPELRQQKAAREAMNDTTSITQKNTFEPAPKESRPKQKDVQPASSMELSKNQKSPEKPAPLEDESATSEKDQRSIFMLVGGLIILLSAGLLIRKILAFRNQIGVAKQ